MDTCASCQAELAPEWKYCIRCGAPVHSATERIPGAIRPDLSAAAGRRRPDTRLLVAGAVGAIGLFGVIFALLGGLGGNVG